MLRFLPLKAKAEVRDATRSSSTFASPLISSSVIPSEKYSLSLSLPMLTNGRTAIELRGAVPASSNGTIGAPLCDKKYQPTPAAASALMPTNVRARRAPSSSNNHRCGSQRRIASVEPDSKLPSTSVAVWGRSEGFFRSKRETSCASQLGIPGTLLNGGGSPLRILAAVAEFDSEESLRAAPDGDR